MIIVQRRIRRGPSPRADKDATVDDGLGRPTVRRSAYVRYLRFSIQDPARLTWGSRAFDGVRITTITPLHLYIQEDADTSLSMIENKMGGSE